MSPEDKVVLRWKCHGQSSGKLMVPAPAGRQADRFGGDGQPSKWLSCFMMVKLYHMVNTEHTVTVVVVVVVPGEENLSALRRTWSSQYSKAT